tara:strand:- start:25 stop:543 length:519 start_codon:yes stop_codon:yes gene_type:complete
MVGKVKKMEQVTGILAVYLVITLMAGRKSKKAPIFGQMTLTSELALEYLKSSMDGFSRRATKILWLTPLEAQTLGYAVPQWVVENYEKYEWSAIIIDERVDTLPLYVYQKSALALLEAELARLEAEGASISQDNPRMMTIDLGETALHVRFWRNPKGGKFAKYYLDLAEQSD